jgi:hypothetical protein
VEGAPGCERAAVLGITIREAVSALDALANRLRDSDSPEIAAIAERAAIARDHLASAVRTCFEEQFGHYPCELEADFN